MKNIARNYQLKKTELTIKNEIQDAIYIYSRLSFLRTSIFDSIYTNQYRYR